MTACIVCPPAADGSTHEPDYEWGLLCCRRVWGRMAAALRPYAIADLWACLELSKGSGSAPKVSGSRERPIPPRMDALDLSMPARHGSLAVHVGRYAGDQVGHLAVATELDFWARDWADMRGESPPRPLVPLLCSWLSDRLDWACRTHPALDEFATAVGRIYGALMAAGGLFDPPPETLAAPCPGCHMLTLYRDRDMQRIVCGAGCPHLLTEDDYAEYAQRLIKEAS